MNTFISAVLVGLVGVFCMWDSRLLGRLNFEQPLVGATLVGLLLGLSLIHISEPTRP